jgi:hypothetical protein
VRKRHLALWFGGVLLGAGLADVAFTSPRWDNWGAVLIGAAVSVGIILYESGAPPG